MADDQIKKYSTIIKIITTIVFVFIILYVMNTKPELKKENEEYFRETKFNTCGGQLTETGWNLIKSGNNNLLIIGDTMSFGSGSKDFYLIKMDLQGDLISTRTFGDAGNDVGISLVKTKNVYMLAGGSNSFGNGDYDVYVIAVNEDGEQLWDKTYGGVNYDFAYSIINDNENFVLAGYTSSFNDSLNSDGYILKINNRGKLLWQKTYGGNKWDIFYSIVKDDDGYVAVGYTDSFGNGKTDFYAVKTDFYGNAIWSKTYGGIREDRATTIIKCNDGGFLIGGKSTSYIARGFGWDIFLVRIDDKGDTKWIKSFPASELEVGNSIIQEQDNGFVVAGIKKCYGICDSNAYVIRTDADGNTKWIRIFAGKRDDVVNSICKVKDGYVIAGTTGSDGNGNGDVLLMKVGFDGEKIW
ncbi:MAG: hypothetical protein KA120_07205 [Candidatus Goldbacteria bacterium]|nr:hypothetical protein [Candidatus Goldiibacteriota bacterium]